MGEYDDLADRVQRGELAGKPGTVLRGPQAAAAGRRMLMEATGQSDLDEVVRIALGRPRVGAEGPSPVWKVRVSAQLDAQLRAAAHARGVGRSQLVREAVAAFLAKAG